MYRLLVVVLVWDPKERFMERVTMFISQITGLIWVVLVK
jgi:hypothetical protein